MKKKCNLRQELLSPSETAAILGCSRQTIYNRQKTGRLEAHREGTRMKFKRATIEAYLASLRKVK